VDSLQVDGLTRRFGDRVAVADLSFRAGRGEVLGFLGPNGAGKTTTFKLLSGLILPDAGTLRLDGAPTPFGSRDLRARMGVVFQHPSVDAKLTGRENLAMGAALYGLSGRLARERIEWGLSLVELGDRADEPVERYSGGMRRRLELARVLLHEPELLLMDEPTQGLDVAAARRIWSQLFDIRKKRGLTILLTTHSPEEAERCDRIVVLDKGRAIAEGEPSALRTQVGGNVVTIEADDPDELVPTLVEKLGVEASVADGRIVFDHESAHELIPRVVEALPRGRIKSIGMRQASIGDVFLALTGKTIDGADADEAVAREAASKRRKRSAASSERGA
jgi:ABC-2 type transport system ATP-binding protein